MTEDLTPSFLITTEDTLSEAGYEQLRNDIQIAARSVAPDPHDIAARNQWPDPPGPDATYEDLKRYITVRATAGYFLAIDEAADWPAELKLSPVEAWALAEETWERMAEE